MIRDMKRNRNESVGGEKRQLRLKSWFRCNQDKGQDGRKTRRCVRRGKAY